MKPGHVCSGTHAVLCRPPPCMPFLALVFTLPGGPSHLFLFLTSSALRLLSQATSSGKSPFPGESRYVLQPLVECTSEGAMVIRKLPWESYQVMTWCWESLPPRFWLRAWLSTSQDILRASNLCSFLPALWISVSYWIAVWWYRRV